MENKVQFGHFHLVWLNTIGSLYSSTKAIDMLH